MRPSSRVALALSATAVLALFTGCGSTLYDATGVPQLVLQCTNPQVPVACAQGCVAESDAACGKSCLDCVGDAAASPDPNAANACDRTSASIADHVCDFTCPAGMQKDLVNKRCACTAATQVRCVGSNACVDQGPTLCGASCEDCTTTPPPAHASRICDATPDGQRQCGFACDAGSGFAKNAQGDRCVCADATKVSCGGGAPGGACVTEDKNSCSDACINCLDPAQFKVNLANVAATTIACNTQASVHQCDWSCPPAANPTFTEKFLNASGQADCRAPSCGGGQHKCPTTPGATACFAANDLNHCGDACSDCAVASVPPGASPACVPDAVAGFACSFTCPAGTLKSNGACVQIRATPGSVATGANHTCVITTQGTLMCWGANNAGQLGLAPGADRPTPTDIPIAGVQFVAAGGDRTCAVIGGLPGGNVRCWGGGSAALVDPGVTAASAVAVGTGHACAIVGGGVQCWGANDKGQVGNGGPLAPNVAAPTPVKTASATNLGGVTKLSTSADHTCALDTAGAVWCWGANDRGQVGQPLASAAVPSATRIIASQATDVAAGGKHSCAASPTRDAANKAGDSKCWGDDALSQLGDGVTGQSSVPVFTTQLFGKADLVAAGRAHTCNTVSGDAAASLICAGADDLFQAGLPPIAPATTPPASTVKGQDLGFGTSIAFVTSGGDHTCAVTIANAMRCWGSNAHGQLGLGPGAASSTVTPVAPLPQ